MFSCSIVRMFTPVFELFSTKGRKNFVFLCIYFVLVGCFPGFSHVYSISMYRAIPSYLSRVSKEIGWFCYFSFWDSECTVTWWDILTQGTKILKMVFCYRNCSDLLWEKIVPVIEKNFWNSRLKAKNLQKFWDNKNNLFKQWKVRTIFDNRMLF